MTESKNPATSAVYQALYRKWRPQRFAEVVNQEYTVKTLRNSISSGEISHAYLFAGPRGIGKCVKFDTQIVDALTGELTTIEEVYQRRRANLLTLRDDYKFCPAQPVDFIDDGIKPCYKVTTATGREIEVTLSHPFLTIKGWRRLSELKVGDRIGVPRCLPIFGKAEIPDYQVRLIAHLIAEGSTSQGEQTVSKLTSSQVGKSNLSYRAHQKTLRNYLNKPGQCRNTVIGFAKSLGMMGQTSREKTIPPIIFQLSKPALSLFLRVLYSGDGGVYWPNPPLIAYYSSSKKLIQQVQHLLLRFGIISRARYKPSRGILQYAPTWALEITHRESLRTFIQRIGLLGKKAERLRQLAAYLADRPSKPNRDVIPVEVYELVRLEKGACEKRWCDVGKALGYKTPKKASPRRYSPSREKLRVYGEVFGSQQIMNLANSDLYWDEIVSIEYSGNSQVYDLTVPETHNFVANDFIVHNTTVARLFAKAINCPNQKDGEPCNECDSCKRITKGNVLDVIEIDGASNRGIDQIRQLREEVNFVPAETKYKVYIIDEVHMLTNEAFNALLKTLEEPPKRVIFIFATTEPHKVPLTVLSRCLAFEFKNISPELIKKRLEGICTSEKIKASDHVLTAIARRAKGSLRDAEVMLEQLAAYAGSNKIEEADFLQVMGLAGEEAVSNFLKACLRKDVKTTLRMIDELAEAGKDFELFVDELVEYTRDLLVAHVDGREIALKASFEELLELSARFLEIKREMGRAWDKRILLELRALELTGTEPDVAKPIPEPKSTEVKVAKSKAKGTPAKKSEEKMKVETKSASTDERWEKMLEAIKQEKKSMVYAFLSEAKPIEEQDRLLILFAPEFKFHKEGLEQKENKKFLEAMVSKFYGARKLVIDFSMESATVSGSEAHESELRQKAELVRKTLGGEILT